MPLTQPKIPAYRKVIKKDSIEYLIQITKDMRKAQVSYNRDWSASALARTTLAEQRVDDWLKQYAPEDEDAKRPDTQ